MKEILNIVCCCDRYFMIPLIVMLFSVSKNLQKPLVKIHIITYNFSEDELEYLKQNTNFSNFQVYLYNYNEDKLLNIFPECEQYPKSIYLKIYIPNILPSEIKKVIFLDSDLIVLSSIHLLNEINLENKIILAACEMGETLQYAKSKNGIGNYKKISIPGNQKMFNSGVMVIDLQRMREIKFIKKVEDYCKIYKNNIKLFDQELFNIILWKEWKELNPCWNVSTDYYKRGGWLSELSDSMYNNIRKSAKIIHYTKVPKPWVTGCNHPDRTIWEDYFKCVPCDYKNIYIKCYNNPVPIVPGESGEYIN